MNTVSKYETIDWKKYQILYDEGKTWGELIRYGISNNAISWARKNGKLIMRTSSETRKINHINGKYDYSSFKTPEHKKLMSKFGGYKENSGRCKHILFKKNDGTIVTLQGSWEERIAIFFEKYNIKWSKNRIGYKYIFNNKTRLYFPDFFLDEYNIYIEVKGYETEKDVSKWNQFPFKLYIVKKQEINNLKNWWQSLNLKDIENQKEIECIYSTLRENNIKIEKEFKQKNNNINRIKSDFKRRMVEWPSKEILEMEIKTTPLIILGKKYGVSDVSIKKWCKKYNIEVKTGRGFWTHKQKKI